MKTKVLILGSKGVLGQELVRVFAEDGRYEIAGWDVEDIDVTDFEAAGKRIRGYAPDIVLNAIAYNAVDACEENDDEYWKAVRLNAEVPGFLAGLGRELDAVFVHYSTDYVFGQNDPEHTDGYVEDDMPEPQCRYGRSKCEGELAVRKEGEKYYIVRLSKLFGKPAASAQGKRSFFEVMLEAGRTKDEVKAVQGEMSCFTYAPDLALASKELAESGDPYGTYHLVNMGAVTWYDGVVELYRQVGLATRVVPVGPEAFPRPAKRPEFSVLLNTKRPPLRTYREALAEYLDS
jgi:dTDP-4-dehydrorhamnose reductase